MSAQPNKFALDLVNDCECDFDLIEICDLLIASKDAADKREARKMVAIAIDHALRMKTSNWRKTS